MTSSGTYDFNPAISGLTLYSFGMCGIRPAALTQDHLFTARMAANMVLGSWSNQGVNLWAVELVTVPLVQGQIYYDVDPNTMSMLDAYCTIDDGVSDPIDRIIMPISRTEYAAYSNKEQQGFPTSFWFDRLLAPRVYLWPVPDGSSAQYLKYYKLKQLQDASLGGGQTANIPQSWMEAFAVALASRIAITWAPDKAMALKAFAEEAYDIASTQNIEFAATYVSPSLGGYYR